MIYSQRVITMFELDNELLAQIIGFIGTAFIVIGMQQKKYDHIVLCKIANSFLSSVHYLFLGGYTGMCINLASCFTNAVYWRRNKLGKSNLIFQILFGAMFVALGLLSWHSPFSMFVIIAKLISSVAMGIHNPRIIRILNLISFPCWLIYNIHMGSFSGIISDSLSITSVVIGIIRLDILGKEQEKTT